MKDLFYYLPDVFYAINVVTGCLLVGLFILIITSISED
jgi:hypothetical protein